MVGLRKRFSVSEGPNSYTLTCNQFELTSLAPERHKIRNFEVTGKPERWSGPGAIGAMRLYRLLA